MLIGRSLGDSVGNLTYLCWSSGRLRSRPGSSCHSLLMFHSLFQSIEFCWFMSLADIRVGNPVVVGGEWDRSHCLCCRDSGGRRMIKYITGKE